MTGGRLGALVRRRRFRDWPLGLKLSAAMVALAVVPLVVVTGLDLRGERARSLAAQTAVLAARADQLIDNLDQFNRGHARHATGLARLPEVQEVLARPTDRAAHARAGATLRLHAGGDPELRGIAVIDRAGRVLTSTIPAAIGQALEFRGYVRAALAGAPTISDPYLSATTDSYPTIAFAAPVRDAAGVTGVAVIWIRAHAMERIARASDGLAGATSYAAVYDGDGIRIAHPRPERLFQPAGVLPLADVLRLRAERRFGDTTRAVLADVRPVPALFALARGGAVGADAFRILDGDGRPVFVVARRFRSVGWTAFYVVDAATAEAPAAAIRTRHLVTALGAGGLALALATLLGAVVLRPLRRLTDVSRRFAGGERGARVGNLGADEIGQLGRVFDATAVRLEQQADVLARSHAELERLVEVRTAELAASERRYRELFEDAPDIYLTASLPDRKILDCNATACAVLGFTKEELIGREFDTLYVPESRAHIGASVSALAAGIEVRDLERRIASKDGALIDVSVNLRGVRDAAGTLIGGRAVWRDITRRKQSDRAQLLLLRITETLRASTDVGSLLDSVAEDVARHLGASRCGFVRVEAARDLVVVERDYHGDLPSLAGELPLAAFGEASRAAGERGEAFVVPDAATDPRTAAVYPLSFAHLGVRGLIAVPQRRDGRWASSLVVTTAEPRAWDDSEVRLLQLIGDRVWAWVEQLRLAETLRATAIELAVQEAEARQAGALRQSLREREVLMQEVHHRVKNNLQLISSLIRMQLRRVEPGVAREALEETQLRVHAIALLHEQLYQARDYAALQFAAYARSLAQGVLQATGMTARGITLDLALEDVMLELDRAIPCGLAINELMTNALKHAFADGRPGTVRVALARAPGGMLRLEVRDDGVGLPAGLDVRATRSLGMQLVCSLARQLDADLAVGAGPGASFTLTFPEVRRGA